MLIPALSLIFAALAASAVPDAPPPARFGTLKFSQQANVTRVTFDNPPINLVSANLIADFFDFMQWLRPAQSNATSDGGATAPALKPKVVIFDSANPDFFLSHIDFQLIREPITQNDIDVTTRYEDVAHYLQNITSTAFIAEVNGRAFGAGQELIVQMDMRFAGPNASTGSFENSLGLTAGGGGQLFLPLFVNKGRAMEYLLAAKAFDAPTGTALGLFNADFPDAGSLRKYVDDLAARIGLFPSAGLNQTKASLTANFNPSLSALNTDVLDFFNILPMAAEQDKLTQAFTASQNETASPFEQGLPDSILSFYQ